MKAAVLGLTVAAGAAVGGQAIAAPMPTSGGQHQAGNGSPEAVNPQQVSDRFGIPDGNYEIFKQVAEHNKVLIYVRPSNTETPSWLWRGGMAKPLEIKAKTINAIDAKYLGYDRNYIGAVGFKDPDKPDLSRVPEFDRPKVEARYNQRKAEYANFLAEMNGYAQNKKFVVDNGVVFGFDVSNKRQPIVGDHDVYDIRNPDGTRVSADKHTQVINQLKDLMPAVQHGAHRFWEVPDAQKYKDIDNVIRKSHQPGGEPLVVFGNGSEADLRYDNEPLAPSCGNRSLPLAGCVPGSAAPRPREGEVRPAQQARTELQGGQNPQGPASGVHRGQGEQPFMAPSGQSQLSVPSQHQQGGGHEVQPTQPLSQRGTPVTPPVPVTPPTTPVPSPRISAPRPGFLERFSDDGEIMVQLVQPWIDRIYADNHQGLSETQLASYFFHDLHYGWPEQARTTWRNAWSALPEKEKTGENAQRIRELIIKQITDQTNKTAGEYNFGLGPRDLERIIEPAKEALKEEENKNLEERYGTPPQHIRFDPKTQELVTSEDQQVQPQQGGSSGPNVRKPRSVSSGSAENQQFGGVGFQGGGVGGGTVAPAASPGAALTSGAPSDLAALHNDQQNQSPVHPQTSVPAPASPPTAAPASLQGGGPGGITVESLRDPLHQVGAVPPEAAPAAPAETPAPSHAPAGVPATSSQDAPTAAPETVPAPTPAAPGEAPAPAAPVEQPMQQESSAPTLAAPAPEAVPAAAPADQQAPADGSAGSSSGGGVS